MHTNASRLTKLTMHPAYHMKQQTPFNIADQLPGFIGWKDKNFHYMGCNRNLASILQLENPEHIVGLQDTDLADFTETSFQLHRANDEKALSGETIQGFHQSTSPYDGSLFYFSKKPMIDADKNTIGIIFYCQPFVPHPSLLSMIGQEKNHCPSESLPTFHQTSSQKNSFNLSTRELECLYCLLRGMHAKQIADRLTLSKRTIEFYIDNIKNKLGCQNKHELISLAISAGYMNIIPPRFLTLP